MARIVLCEDDPSIQKLVQAALRPTGHEVLVACDGVEGLRLIGEMRPDLVLTDLVMPNLGGLDLVDAMKARPEIAAIPIILVTASVQRAQLDEAYRHGIDGHLGKPFNAKDLVDLIRHFLNGVGMSTIVTGIR